MARYHPTDDMLIDYATGGLSTATSLLMACHLTYCPQCRAKTGFFEDVGGALLEAAATVRLRTPRLIDPGQAPESTATPDGDVDDDMVLPRPLRRWVGCAATELPWRRVIPGIFEVPLGMGPPEADAKLMRIRPGRGVPRHTHEGTELTLVLTGAFSDDAGHYRRGDVALADPTVDHRPLADSGGECICLAVTDAPLRLTGPLGRVVSLFRKT